MVPCSEEEYYYKADNMMMGSTQFLRDVFKIRWKTESGQEWVNENSFILEFLNGLGKLAFKIALQKQKETLLASCSVEGWDMTLLCLILQNFGGEKYERDNKDIKTLKEMRNELAHLTIHKLTQLEYNERLKTFKECLTGLGMEGGDIDKLIQRSGLTSSLKAQEKVNALYCQAEEFIKVGKIDQAIQIFSEAISTPSLLPEHLGEAYEKRADCYLKSVKNQVIDGTHCDQALLDVMKAVELNSSSWKAYYIAAQIYRRKNKLLKATRYYEMALAISPAHQQMKQDLDSCKVLAGVQTREDHLNPNLMPTNLNERVALVDELCGTKLTPKIFTSFWLENGGKICEGLDDVFRGDQHLHGWDVPQDFKKAAEYFAKADSVGNPEGSYYLGCCYMHGRGVQQDVVKAFQIFKKAAEMDKNIHGGLTPLKCNTGVAYSQHSVGLMYHYGTGVELNYTEAAAWYKRGMESGVGNSANNLGTLYTNGLGVPLDQHMAEMCWKEGVILRSSLSAEFLMKYYINELEPVKALAMLQNGRKIGNANCKATSDEEIGKKIERVKKRKLELESKVLEFERVQNLHSKGLTFHHRFLRTQQQLDPNIYTIKRILAETQMQEGFTTTGNWGGKVQQQLTEANSKAMFQRVRNGSETAMRFIETFNKYYEITFLLKENNELSKAQEQQLLELQYSCVFLEPYILTTTEEWHEKMKTIVAQQFEEKCNEKGEDDMKIRLCFVKFNLAGSFTSISDTFALEILKEGLHRYPNNVAYYDMLSFCLSYKQKHEDALRIAQDGLKMFPGNIKLLYARAVHIGNCANVENSKILEAILEFLDAAPVDHRMVPEAYYNICYRNLFDKTVENNGSTLQKIIDWFKKGLEAEKIQLPVYLPYGESDVKRMVKCCIDKLLEVIPRDYLQKTGDIEGKSKMVVGVLEEKKYLKSPTRKGLILEHRQYMKVCAENHLKSSHSREHLMLSFTTEPKLKQPVVRKMAGVTAITLVEMSPIEDHIFKNRVLNLTIIDEPNPFDASIDLVAEDDNGDVTRLYIYKARKNQATWEKFQVGCRIAIINPYMRIGASHISNGIRNDDPKCIVYLDKVESMCRFCGEPNAAKKCSICKRPYCSRECQKLDWKEFDHKLICSLPYPLQLTFP